MRSAEEAVAYAKELHKIVTWIGICDGNMQEGSFRCDGQRVGAQARSAAGHPARNQEPQRFKFMQQAMDFEIRWQIEQIEDGHASSRPLCCSTLIQGKRVPCAPRKTAADYRYFPDPIWPPLVIFT